MKQSIYEAKFTSRFYDCAVPHLELQRIKLDAAGDARCQHTRDAPAVSLVTFAGAMEHPHFEKQKDAAAWVVAGAIDDAVEPFLTLLSDAGVDELREILADAAATHPVFTVLLSRAAQTVMPVREEAPRLREAARLEDRIPKVDKEKPERDHALVGEPDLERPEYYNASIGVIKRLAGLVAEKSRAPKKGELRDTLVREGWVVACEVHKDWDRSKASYSTFLWRFVRARMINFAKRGSNWREVSAGAYFDTLEDKHLHATDAVGRFHEAMNNAATSVAFGFAEAPETPEDSVSRVRDGGTARAALGTLDERAQKLLALVFGEGMSVRAAAIKLEMKETTARELHDRSIEELRKLVGESSNVRTLASRKKKGR
jgi:RNA polymerase sigma factor (sigma-70 family)